MLAVPRPRTRNDCLEEARPCPWVGCRYHLLLEIVPSKNNRSTKIGLAGPRARRAVGRRRALPASAAQVLVEVWIDDALEQLVRMRHTCALDVVAEHGAINDSSVGQLLGITRQGATAAKARALVRMHAGLSDLGV